MVTAVKGHCTRVAIAAGEDLIRWDPHNSFRPGRPWHRMDFSFTNHLATPPLAIQPRCFWVLSERLLIPVARKPAPRLTRLDSDTGRTPVGSVMAWQTGGRAKQSSRR